MSCRMKHLKLSIAEKSNILWRKVKEKYIWGSSAHEHIYYLSICIEFLWWHYRILLRVTGIAKQHARVKAIMQYSALEWKSVRWIQWAQIHVCVLYGKWDSAFLWCREQFEGSWKGADSAWRKCSWCGEEGERHTFLSLVCKFPKSKPAFLSLPWSVPPGQTSSAWVLSWGATCNITSDKLISQGWYCYIRYLTN